MALSEAVEPFQATASAFFYFVYESFVELSEFYAIYGTASVVLYIIADTDVWSAQARVLLSLSDADAESLREYYKNDCNTKGLASAIVAQISITAFAFADIDSTHWIVRALWIFSLTASLMAVYYANHLQTIVGQLLNGREVRAWIRGGRDIERPVAAFSAMHEESGTDASPARSHSQVSQLRETLYTQIATPNVLTHFLGSKNHERIPRSPALRDAKAFKGVEFQDIAPTLSSVITISAPEILLSMSLVSLLSGLGVYLLELFVKRVEPVVANRNVLIFFCVGIFASVFIYGLFSLLQSEGAWTGPIKILEDGVRGYRRRLDELQWRERERDRQSYAASVDFSASHHEHSGNLHNVKHDINEPRRSRRRSIRFETIPIDKHEGDSVPEGPASTDGLVQALREAAKLRRATAQADERVAEIYERLARTDKSPASMNRG